MTPSAKTTEPPLRIGNVAAQTGVTVETLRYYEQRGLLRPVGRGTGGYRQYPTDAVRVVRFIKRAQSLGFSLTEIEQLVRLRERAWTGDAPRRLRDVAAAKVRDINRRVRELRALGRELTELIAACDAGCTLTSESGRDASGPAAAAAAAGCPLVDAFDADVAATEPSSSRGAEGGRARRRGENSRNGPPKPGRRIPRP
jgi:MerR family mercuric resistance operon transcriptional regulator